MHAIPFVIKHCEQTKTHALVHGIYTDYDYDGFDDG